MLKYHIEGSFRYVIIASIGLIIALSVLSSSILFIDSQKGVILEDVFENISPNLRVTHDRSYNSTKNNTVSQLINESLKNFDLQNRLESYAEYSQAIYNIANDNLWLQKNQINSNNFRFMELTRIYNFPYLDVFSDFFVPNSEIKDNSVENQEVILLYNTDDEESSDWSPQISEQFEFVFQFSVGGSISSIGLTNVTLSGIIKINTSQLLKLSEKHQILKLANLDGFRGNALFASNLTALHGSKIVQNASFNKFINYRDFYVHIFDIQKFNGFETKKIVDNLEIMKFQLRNTLWDENIFPTHISDTILSRLKLIERDASQLFTNILLFALPVILIAVILAYYSFGLIRRQKLQILSIYLSHGISQLQYLTFLIFEMVLTLIIAIVIGIISSIPITVFTIRTSGFFEFNNPIFLSPQMLTIDLIQFLAQYGIVLAFIINILQIINYLTFSMKEVERESVEERENPFWKRKYLDIIFLSFGLTFYLVTAYSIDLGSIIPSEMLSLFSLPSPILIILGSVMLIARIFPYLTQILSTYLWEKKGSLLSFSLKNITLRRYSTTRALILISLSFAFMISFISFPYSFISHEETKLHYEMGSDIVIDLNFNEINYTRFENLLENYTDHIESYTPVLLADLASNPIMVVNTTTFPESAWMKEEYIQDFEKTLKKIDIDNSSILIYEGNLQSSQSNIDKIFIWISSEEADPEKNQSVMSFMVRGTFTFWPNLLNRLPVNPRVQLFGIMNFETFNATRDKFDDLGSSPITDQRLELYVNPKSSLNQTLFKSELESLTEISEVSLYEQERDRLFNNALFFSLIGQINSNILYTLGIIILVIVMFGFMQLVERSREIATERSFGMMIKQNFFIIFFENFWLLTIGIVSGVILGYFFSSLFLLSIVLGTGFPPFVMIYPMEFILGFVALILGISILFSFIPAYFSTKIDITRLLRVE
jgi:ABC-type antimicrobial peptide transport system permease subunit